MFLLLFFAFISGVITIFAPCIWPLLPIILSSTASGGSRKPLGITIGIMISFALLTLSVSYVVSLVPFDPNILRYVAVVIISFIGLSLIIPKISYVLETYVSRFSGKLGRSGSNSNSGFQGGLITGLSLGIVWTPCAGPILATIATLSATKAVNLQIILVTIVYVLGVGIPLFLLAIFGQKVFSKVRGLSKYTGRIQQLFGVIMILTAAAILTNYDKTIQVKLLNAFPAYSSLLLRLENNPAVKRQLDSIKGNKITEEKVDMPFPKATSLPRIAKAPDFIGINNWLNTNQALSINKLKGKIVLVDFWTYTCINCIRTLPHVTSWYNKYKDQNFMVIGVHTPEFEFEKRAENVLNAIKQYDIKYPVAQDNDYSTWKAYDNHYWPAKYLIDSDGYIRYFHFGEGQYEETEKAIQTLIEEAGSKVKQDMVHVPDQTPNAPQTPETYLGYARMDRFASYEPIKTGKSIYSMPVVIPENTVAYSGEWEITDESAKSKKGKLKLNFHASKVFLVITPHSTDDRIEVYLDGKVISNDMTGIDVKDGFVKLDVPRLYELVNISGERDDHVLELQFNSEGTEIFAFTFG